MNHSLTEEKLDSRELFHGKFLHAFSDQVRLPDGTLAQREYLVHPGAVMVIPLLPDGRVVLERQYRYPVQQAMIEFPAGKLDPGELPLDCAQRELHEETGYRAGEWARAGVLHPCISYSTELIEIWFARELQAGERQLDAGEFLDVETIDLEVLDEAVRRGDVTDAKTMIGLLWLQNWRAGRWPLEWRPAPAAPPAPTSR